MKVYVGDIFLGTVVTNRSLTVAEAMYALGYDIMDPDDLQFGYQLCIPGFYMDDHGHFCFDEEVVSFG